MRICIEVEANFKAILDENGYVKKGRLDMSDYKKVGATHHLSSYEVKLPQWHGSKNVRSPFDSWKSGASLPWYQAYNASKHDRHQNFQDASFDNLVDSVCGLVVLLSAQFWTRDFSPTDFLVTSRPGDEFETAIGDYFQVKFPTDWPDSECYDFNWHDLEKQADPFQSLVF